MPLKWGECVSTDPSAHKQKTFETPPKIGMQNPGDSGRTHFSTASVQTSPSNNSKAKNHIGVIVVAIAIAIIFALIYLADSTPKQSGYIDIYQDTITVVVGSSASVPFSSSSSDIELSFDSDYLGVDVVQSDDTNLHITGLREGTVVLRINHRNNKNTYDSIEVIIRSIPLSLDNPYYECFNPVEVFVLPYSNSYYYEKADLLKLSKEQLVIARNEIFARHGYIFQTDDIAEYFDACSWYHGTIYGSNFSYNVFNDYENSNVALIIAYEREMGYRT